MIRRRRGTGSIEKYPDASGEWRYRARIVLASGRRIPVGVCTTHREAEIILEGALERYQAGSAVELAGVTVRQWGTSFLDQREEQGIRGIKTERNRWKNLVDASPLADLVLRAVVRRDAKQWLAWLQSRRIKYQHAHSKNGKKLSRVTLQNAMNLVRKAFDVALDDELITVNPFAGVHLPRNPGRTDDPWTFLTPTEQANIIAATPERERPTVMFAMGSGLRQSEQWSLEWPDVLANAVTVRYGSAGLPTKSGKIRQVPLLGMAASAISSFGERKGRRGLVFPAPSGERRQKGEPDGWKDWVRAAGIDRNVRWHDLRHTCGTSLVRGWWGRQWSLQEVKEMLGHRSITTTERYAHGAELRKAAEETVMPAVSPEPLENPTEQSEPIAAELLAGATLGIRTPDLRFTKAEPTEADSPALPIDKPDGGLSSVAAELARATGLCPALVDTVLWFDRLAQAAGRQP